LRVCRSIRRNALEGVTRPGNAKRHCNFGKYYFCDEKFFCVNIKPGSEFVDLMDPDDEPAMVENDRWATKVLFWGVIGPNFRKLIPVDMKLNSATYKTHVLQKISAAFRKNKFVLVQDNASCHRSKETLKWFADQKVLFCQLPARSCDLNPIENLWAIMQHRMNDVLRSRKITTKAALTEAVLEVWEALPQAVIDKLCDSFDERVARCIQLDGGFETRPSRKRREKARQRTAPVKGASKRRGKRPSSENA